MSDRRDFLDTARTIGWKVYESRIQMKIANKALELEDIDTEGKTAEQIGVEHLKLEREIIGMKTALEIAELIKTEPADDM